MSKNNVITHKILPIIGLIFFILFVFTINCFASSVPSVDENTLNILYSTEEYKSGNYYCFVFFGVHSGDTDLWFAFIDKSVDIIPYCSTGLCAVTGENHLCLHCPSSSNYNFILYRNGSHFRDYTNNTLNFCLNYDSGFFANIDVYTDSSCSDFFFDSPLMVTFLPVEIQKIPEIVQEVLIILVPVGLTIFGILLLVYLLHSKRWLHL